MPGGRPTTTAEGPKRRPGRRAAPPASPGAVAEGVRDLTAEALRRREKLDSLLSHHKMRIDAYLTHLAAQGVIKPKDKEHLGRFLKGVVEERNARADEVESSEVREAAEIANALLPNGLSLRAAFCVDGRINGTLKYGIIAGMKFGSFQTPAGDIQEVVPDLAGDYAVLPGSNFAQMLDEAFASTQGTVSELLDSHLGCARRKGVEIAVCNPTDDDGLLQDIKRKKAIAGALRRYTQGRFPDRKIMPLQGSFDPHNGFSFHGLASAPAIAYAEQHGGFTSKVLEDLVREGKLLSTKKLADEFKAEFENQWKVFGSSFDWAKNYRFTALMFWKAIRAMHADLIPRIKIKLQTMFPDSEDAEEMEIRSLLLLANAFNGFCNNHNGHYPYGKHTEALVGVSRRDFRPFNDHVSFGVNDKDLENMPYDVVFSAGIVRGNRGETVNTNDYDSVAEYKAAPVAVAVKEVFYGFPGEEMTEDKWEKLRRLDWTFLQEVDWVKMTDDAFMDFVTQRNPSIAIGHSMSKAIRGLREKMISLYDPAKPAAAQLMNGKLVALPVICDRSRRVRLFIPFHQKGFAVNGGRDIGRGDRT